MKNFAVASHSFRVNGKIWQICEYRTIWYKTVIIMCNLCTSNPGKMIILENINEILAVCGWTWDILELLHCPWEGIVVIVSQRTCISNPLNTLNTSNFHRIKVENNFKGDWLTLNFERFSMFPLLSRVTTKWLRQKLCFAKK